MKSYAYRASIAQSLGPETLEYFEDGILWIEGGRVRAMGDAAVILGQMPPNFPVTRLENCLLVPGFVDAHTHFAQSAMMGAAGWGVLEWLKRFTYPTESKFSDPVVATRYARFFLDQCLSHGTTTALVFATVHKVSAEALFEEAFRKGVRLIAGKVLMNRNAPSEILDTPESGYADSRDLAKKWHGKGRLAYAVTPRFAPTSSPAQLDEAARLLDEFPTVYLHTHLAESLEESAWVRSLYPSRSGYLDVYDHHRLLREQTVLAHCIHLAGQEYARIGACGSSIAFCPTSNLFLGSGLFPLREAESHGVRVGLGTDIGAGTGFSLMSTAAEAYKVGQLRGEPISAAKALYLATLGGARALRLEDKIGNFAPGKEADFVALDLGASDLLRFRLAEARSIEEKLFALFFLSDQQTIKATFIEGRPSELINFKGKGSAPD